MKTVLSRKDLPGCRDLFVFVERENAMYVRVGGEYIKKRYFDVSEVAKMLGVTRNRIHRYCYQLGVHAKANKYKKIRITLPQLQMIVEQTKKQDA